MGDLSAFPLDGPVPEPIDPELRSRAAVLLEHARANNMTIRQLYLAASSGRGHRTVIGTPEQIADHMQEWVEARAADGSSFDPMGPAATQTYIQGMVVYDMLFALDE